MVSKKYARDHTLKSELDGRGRLRTVAVYTGPRFRYTEETAKRLPEIKRRLIALAALCALLVLAPLIPKAEIVGRWYVLPPLVLAIIPAAGLVQLCWRIYSEKEPFTRLVKDRLTGRIAPCSMSVIVLCALSLIGQVVYYISHPASAGDWAITVFTAAAIIPTVLLFLMRNAVKTEQQEAPEPSENDGDANQI